ncbi:MAG: polysaccharide deacetylase family protein [Clostridia bacterium]
MRFRVISRRRARRDVLLTLLALLVLALAGVIGERARAAEGVLPPSGPVYSVRTSQKLVALGINVVWGTEYVGPLLHALKSDSATATFFLGGAWTEANPALARTLAAAGMEIGNHGFQHRHQSLLNFDENLNEITRASRAIELATGVRPALFAPPYGEYNQTVLRAVQSLHLTLVMWTIDTIDWRPSSSPGLITERVLKKVRPGAIILMHPTERTKDALPGLLKTLRQDGYKVVSISALLQSGTASGE